MATWGRGSSSSWPSTWPRGTSPPVSRSWWRRAAPQEREPAGGVSSFHLWWDGLPGEPVAAVAATLEVLVAPSVDRLYFWALQASFVDASGHRYGAAHLGLQWNPRFPRSRAANWGGYAEPPARSILDGTPSPLPSTPNDPNTRDYPWEPGHPYRLRIHPGERGWGGSITDLGTGETVEVRQLLAGGDRLAHAVVWSEVFARCDHPGVAVRWTDLEAIATDGRVLRPSGVRLSFPSGGDCPNTDVELDAGGGLVQKTNQRRAARPGAVLPISSG